MRAATRWTLVLALMQVLPAACQDDLCFHKYEVFMCAAQEECAAGFLCDMERCWCREASRVPAERTLPLPHVDCAAKRRALLEDSSKLEGRGECRRPEDGY